MSGWWWLVLASPSYFVLSAARSGWSLWRTVQRERQLTKQARRDQDELTQAFLNAWERHHGRPTGIINGQSTREEGEQR